MRRNLLSLTACGLAVLSLSACASRPKPPPGPTPADTPSSTTPQESPTPSASSGEAAAGGQADLAARAGDRVYFAFDSHAVAPEARDILVRQAAWLASNVGVSAIVAGSADERGTREYNLALGARRAAAAREVLVANGVDPGRVQTISYGKERPLDPASNAEAWARNRNAHTEVRSGR
ncbi:OmpA family protein [Phenylobacterium sp.]|uniref:OmpA family protein n=1 Tax=Phenylobacterium sp. TaxID=1871053 RepID=UPI003D2C3B5B